MYTLDSYHSETTIFDHNFSSNKEAILIHFSVYPAPNLNYRSDTFLQNAPNSKTCPPPRSNDRNFILESYLYFLGHRKYCLLTPPKIITLIQQEIIFFSSFHLTSFSVHFEMLIGPTDFIFIYKKFFNTVCSIKSYVT